MISRRLTILVAIGFALFGIAAPAITCAAAIQQHDCCPGEETPPCGECPDAAPGPGSPSDHCLSAPASNASGVAHEQSRKLSEPEFDLAATFPVEPHNFSPDTLTEPVRHRWRPPTAGFENPTYLVTGRLRL